MPRVARVVLAAAALSALAHAAAAEPDAAALRGAALRATAARVVAVVTHPAFAANARVYVLWTEQVFESDTDVFAPPRLVQRVDRFVWDGDDLVFEQPVLRFETFERDGVTATAPLRFDADGTLHVVIGAAARGWGQNLVGSAPTEPADEDVVVRLNDDGGLPADNPFAGVAAVLGGDGGAALRAIYAVRPR